MRPSKTIMSSISGVITLGRTGISKMADVAISPFLKTNRNILSKLAIPIDVTMANTPPVLSAKKRINFSKKKRNSIISHTVLCKQRTIQEKKRNNSSIARERTLSTLKSHKAIKISGRTKQAIEAVVVPQPKRHNEKVGMPSEDVEMKDAPYILPENLDVKHRYAVEMDDVLYSDICDEMEDVFYHGIFSDDMDDVRYTDIYEEMDGVVYTPPNTRRYLPSTPTIESSKVPPPTPSNTRPGLTSPATSDSSSAPPPTSPNARPDFSRTTTSDSANVPPTPNVPKNSEPTPGQQRRAESTPEEPRPPQSEKPLPISMDDLTDRFARLSADFAMDELCEMFSDLSV